MKLNNLLQIRARKAKRIGRGFGSGKGGHTSSRGSKGQKARGDVPIIFEGTKTKKSLIKRLPFNRGRGKLKSWNVRSVVINLEDLANWPKGKEVNEENLIKSGLLNDGEQAKILGGGKIAIPLVIDKIKISKSARDMIIAAGGKVTD